MKALLLTLLVLAPACVSAKKHITKNLNEVHTEAIAGGAGLTAVLDLPMEKAVRAAVKSGIKHFHNIAKAAEHAKSHLGGIKDVGWSWKTKLFLGFGGVASLFFLLSRFSMPGLIGGGLKFVFGLFRKKG